MKTIKRLVIVILCASLTLSAVWFSSFAVKTTGDVTESLVYYKEKVYFQGYYWDGGDINTCFPAPVCSASDGSCTCNQFYGGSQCHGFALYLAYRVIGSAPKRTLASYANGATSNGWTCYTRSELELQGLFAVGLQPGDIVRAAHDSSYANGHTAMVWKIIDGEVWFAESWGSKHCMINWTGFNYYSYSLADICERYEYVAIWRNNSIVNNGETSCDHNYVEGHDGSHPHNVYMICTRCGDMYYTGDTTTSDSCLCCTGVHDWDYTSEAAHPHRERRTCRICGKIEYTGKYVLHEDCPECSLVPYELEVSASKSDLSPGDRVTITAAGKNYTSMSVSVVCDGMIVKTFEDVSGPVEYTAKDVGDYSLRLNAVKDGAEITRELAPAFTVSLHVDTASVTADKLSVRYSDGIGRAAAEEAAQMRGAALASYDTSSFTITVDLSGPYSVTDGARYYRFVPGAFNWTEAREIASALGYKLVRVDSKETNDLVGALVGAADAGCAWIGVTDEASEGEWAYTDGTPIEYDSWNIAHGSDYNVFENWTVLYRGGGWCETVLNGAPGGFVMERDLTYGVERAEGGVVLTGLGTSTRVPAAVTLPAAVNGETVVGLGARVLDGIEATDVRLPATLTRIAPGALGVSGTVYAPAGCAASFALAAAGVEWEPSNMGFTDLVEGKWYYDYAKYCYMYGYLSGTAADKFSPSVNMTRGMTVTVLCSIAGVDRTQYENASSFADVPTNAWYSSSVEWAFKAGVAAGYDDGMFHQEKALTREQLAVFMRAFAACRGEDVSVDDADAALDPFNDGESVSAWARDAVAWMVENGMLSGTGEGMISPLKTATRAEICVIIYRMMQRGA